MRIAISLAFLAVIGPTPGLAQTPPALVINGLTAMVDQGPELAIETWFRGSRLENDGGTKQTFVEQFHIFAQQAGAVLGHDVVHVQELGPNYSITYAIIRYETDPLFIAIDMYNGQSGWRLMNIEFNDAADEVFPAGLLGGREGR
jgi:hypothetical protein